MSTVEIAYDAERKLATIRKQCDSCGKQIKLKDAYEEIVLYCDYETRPRRPIRVQFCCRGCLVKWAQQDRTDENIPADDWLRVFHKQSPEAVAASEAAGRKYNSQGCAVEAKE